MATTGTTRVSEADGKTVTTYEVTPEQAGLARATLAELAGGATAEESAAMVRAVLEGEHGPRRDMVLFNAAGALVAAGKADSLAKGVAAAAEIIDSGAARARLQALVEFCQ